MSYVGANPGRSGNDEAIYITDLILYNFSKWNKFIMILFESFFKIL